MSENMSDDDFDAFLVSAEEQDVRNTSIEVQLLAVKDMVSNALTNAGYVDVNDPERHQQIEEAVSRQLQEEDPEVPDGLINEAVAKNELLMRLDENAAVSEIQMVLVASKHMLREGKQFDSISMKRGLYAKLLVMYHLEPDNPIMGALNSVIPGEVIDPESEYMVPYIAEQVQDREDIARRVLEIESEIHSIMRSIGVEENDPSWSAIQNDVSDMYMQTVPYMHTNEGRANLTATLHQMKVNALNPSQRQQLIDFFTTYKSND